MSGNCPFSQEVSKHFLLDTWRAYLYLVKNVEDAVEYRKPGIAMKAIEYGYDLLKGDFFNCYPKFISIEEDARKVIAHFEDLRDSKIKDSARRFFDMMYGKNPENPQIEFEFRQKTSQGMQGGMICDIKREDEIITFFLKIHAARSNCLKVRLNF
uniref:HEPN domain-containing protein n=1 Tax=Heterorhabditis bacteriophora TaxID=37862 RepID=A0A1I7WU20_HETBA